MQTVLTVWPDSRPHNGSMPSIGNRIKHTQRHDRVCAQLWYIRGNGGKIRQQKPVWTCTDSSTITGMTMYWQQYKHRCDHVLTAVQTPVWPCTDSSTNTGVTMYWQQYNHRCDHVLTAVQTPVWPCTDSAAMNRQQYKPVMTVLLPYYGTNSANRQNQS
jgi:hypothetical protein